MKMERSSRTSGGFRRARGGNGREKCAVLPCLSAKTRHNPPWAFTMQQGPVPTQLCCGTSKLGGARLTRMKESHEVHEIRQGPSDERPFCWRFLSVTSCVQSYTVGYLYVTGTVTAESTGNGIISGFKIDHNTGKLTPINGLPVSSGGANPVRAVLLDRQPLSLCSEPGRERRGQRATAPRRIPA